MTKVAPGGSESAAQVDESADAMDRPILRDGFGRILPGSRSISPATSFKDGNCANPGGRPKGVVAQLRAYLEGEKGIPESWAECLPTEVYQVVVDEGLGAALVLSALTLALSPETEASVRAKLFEWIAARTDGPLVKQLQTANLHRQRREVVIVGVMPGDEDGDPPFPPEVTDIEDAEAAAREEANLRRQEALGMAESKEPPRSSGRRRKRAPGESNGRNGGNGAGNGSAG